MHLSMHLLTLLQGSDYIFAKCVWHVVSEDSSHQEVFPADRLNLTDFQGSPYCRQYGILL